MKKFILSIALILMGNISYLKAEISPHLVKTWEGYKRDYAQTFSKSDKDRLRSQIIKEIAALNASEVEALASISWFWNIILADTIQAARAEATRSLKPATIEVLTRKLTDVDLRREGVDVSRILAIIIENMPEEDLLLKLPAFVEGVKVSSPLSDAIKKRLLPLRIAKPEEALAIDKIYQDLEKANMARKAKSKSNTDPAWLTNLSLSDLQDMAKNKSQWDLLWSRLSSANKEVINKLRPEVVEYIFEQLTKDPSYSAKGTIAPGNRLGVAKSLVQLKLDPLNPNFSTVFDAILSGVSLNITPIAGSLIDKAKKIGNAEESARYLKLIEKAKQDRLDAINQLKDRQKALVDESKKAADLDAPKAASGRFWLEGPKAKALSSNLDLNKHADLRDWLDNQADLKDKDKVKTNLLNIIKLYRDADADTRNKMAKAFRNAVAKSEAGVDYLDIIDDLDAEENAAIISQLLIGNDDSAHPLVNKLWKHETKQAGLRGKSVEEKANRRLAFLLHYLDDEQLKDSLKSGAFWVLLSTYPQVAAAGLSPEQALILSQSIHDRDTKSLRPDLANILARITIRLDDQRPDFFNTLLSLATYANDLILTEAILSKFKPYKIRLAKNIGEDAETLLNDTLRAARRQK